MCPVLVRLQQGFRRYDIKLANQTANNLAEMVANSNAVSTLNTNTDPFTMNYAFIRGHCNTDTVG